MSLPGWVAGLIRLLAPPGRAEDVIGDLTELHRRRLERRGRFVAHALAAFFLIRVLESLLFGVEAMDAATYAGMSALILGVAVLASYIPARRAALVDPMQSLQAE